MKYTIHIDQSKCVQWGLNFSEGALVDFLSTLSTWAEPVMIDGELYFFASRNKVLDELPMLTNKPDTVYRLYKSLNEKCVIDYMKQGRRDLVRLTEKGKKWNSEKNPSSARNSEKNPNKLGKKSELDSENFPTDNNTIIDNTTNYNISPKGESASAPRKKSTTKNQNEKRKKVAPKKEKEPALPFQLWEVWADRHERLHAETPTQDKKFFFHLKELSKKLAARIEAQGAEPTPESIANNFGIFLDMLIEKGDAWYKTNFTPDIFNSKFLNIIQLLKQQHNEERARADKYAAVIASFAN